MLTDQALADEVDRIGGCRAPVCDVTVQRLEHLLGTLRAGARASVHGLTELSGLDGELLRAGVAAWAGRQRDRSAATGPLAAAVPVSGPVSVVVVEPA